MTRGRRLGVGARGLRSLALWRDAHGLSIDDVSGLTGCPSWIVAGLEAGTARLKMRAKVMFARRLQARIRDLFPLEEKL